MSLIVVGLSHHTSPIEVRERFAFAENMLPVALQRVRSEAGIAEAVIVSTCNRVELYATSASDPGLACARLREFLARERQSPLPEEPQVYSLTEPASLEHLFKVASGLDSLVLGETEILGQLKKAYELALQNGHTGRILNKAFQRAFSTAKQVRTETNIQRGNTSIGSVAVELAEKLFAAVRDCRVMVIGAGDTSEKTARSLQSRGAQSILVSNRSYERALTLANELGGRALRFDNWEAEFPSIDIIISSTSAPHYILDRVRLERLLPKRASRPLLLIDLAVPRDIDPKVETFENVFLYDIDDLQTIADESVRQRRDDIARCESIIQERVRALMVPPGRPPGAKPGPGSVPQPSQPAT